MSSPTWCRSADRTHCRIARSVTYLGCPPSEFRGVRLEGEGSLRRLVAAQSVLDDGGAARITAVLARELPAES
jgi:hypothetical protein